MRRLLRIAIFVLAGCASAFASDPCELARSSLAAGDIALNEYKTDIAVVAFQRATILSPDCEQAWLSLGSAYFRKYVPYWHGNLGFAIYPGQNVEDLRKAADAKNSLAIAAASNAYQKALAINPKSDVALKCLARIYAADLDWEHARPWFEHAIQQNPEDAGLYESRAQLMTDLIELRYRERRRSQNYSYNFPNVPDTECVAIRAEDSEQLERAIDDYRKVTELLSEEDRAMWVLSSHLNYRSKLHCGDREGGAADRTEAKQWSVRAADIMNRRIHSVEVEPRDSHSTK
jgi:tetratricopeptide (TPR) repeat protein